MCKDFAVLSNNPNKIEPVFLQYPTIVDFSGKKVIHVFVPASSQVHKTCGKVYDRSVDGDFYVRSDE
jgi:ATP-dependent DNA helicase RecG